MKSETVEAKGESEGMTAKEASCAVCGKPRQEWKTTAGRGVERNGLLCCCGLCAVRLDDMEGVGAGAVPARHDC